MKRLILRLFVNFSMNSQTIQELVNEFPNEDAITYSEFNNEALSKAEIITSGLGSNPYRIKLVNLPESWIMNITNKVKDNPTDLLPYLDTKTHDYTAYMLLISSFNLEMPFVDYHMIDLAKIVYSDPESMPSSIDISQFNKDTIIRTTLDNLDSQDYSFKKALIKQLVNKNIINKTYLKD